jgi:hypothetical protein
LGIPSSDNSVTGSSGTVRGLALARQHAINGPLDFLRQARYRCYRFAALPGLPRSTRSCGFCRRQRNCCGSRSQLISSRRKQAASQLRYLTSGIDLLWRYSVHDAFYQPPGVPLVPGSANDKRFLGAQYNLHAEWQATPHINVNAVYVHFFTDGFLRAANAKDIDFFAVWTSYKF